MVRLLRPIALLAPILLPGAAQAHAGSHGEAGFAAGLLHPLTGVDHVLVLMAAGLIAVRLGGRARWALCGATFCATAAAALLSAGGEAPAHVGAWLAHLGGLGISTSLLLATGTAIGRVASAAGPRAAGACVALVSWIGS